MAAAYLFFNHNCILELFRIVCVVFIAQVSHYGKFTTLHKLVLIVYRLAN